MKHALEKCWKNFLDQFFGIHTVQTVLKHIWIGQTNTSYFWAIFPISPTLSILTTAHMALRMLKKILNFDKT